MTTFFRLLKGKWNPPANPTVSFAGRNVLVTGSNIGLGFEAANKYVTLGASRVILAVRNLEKGTKAKEEIIRRQGNDMTACIDVWQLDMDSFASVKAFAERVDRELEHLDVALLNAGVVMRTFQKSPEGWEETMQVNVLSTALLALLLLPKLRASKSADTTAHLTIVSSASHVDVTRDQLGDEGSLLAYCNRPENYACQRQYAISKLFDMYLTDELAALATSPTGVPEVIVTSCCPGFCTSDLGRQYDSWIERIALRLFYGLLGRTTEEGSRTLVRATALGPEAQGKWWKDYQLPEIGALVINEEGKKLQKSLWTEIIDVLKQSDPEVVRYASMS